MREESKGGEMMEVRAVSRSVEEIIDRFAPREKTQIVLIHKDDGTVCTFPYCQKAHDTYEVTYTRTSVKKALTFGGRNLK